MQFKCLALVAAALSIHQAQAALTAKDVVDSLSNITALSADTSDLVKGLNTENVVAGGLKALQSFRQIVRDAANETATITSASDSPPFVEDDQKDICETFTGFVKAQQDLLQSLVDQKGLLFPIPISMPLASVLRFLESSVDKLLSQIIQLVPTCADDSKKELDGLDAAFNETLKAYPVKLHLPEVIDTQIESPSEAAPEDQ
ncbi:hypothetical protein TrVGV298_004585 [Trichoderma virens]|nr:hypothetical protein TrVGV298_004585 [Trichoderma virens]